MLLAFVVLNILTIAYAQPYGNSPQNVITVPPNCPAGQQWINGACRDIWLRAATSPTPSEWKISDIFPRNTITVPPNCPGGQQYINGQCRDIWRDGDLANSLNIINQQLERLWKDYERQIEETGI